MTRKTLAALVFVCACMLAGVRGAEWADVSAWQGIAWGFVAGVAIATGGMASPVDSRGESRTVQQERLTPRERPT
jgi:hypothetical protein